MKKIVNIVVGSESDVPQVEVSGMAAALHGAISQPE